MTPYLKMAIKCQSFVKSRRKGRENMAKKESDKSTEGRMWKGEKREGKEKRDNRNKKKNERTGKMARGRE